MDFHLSSFGQRLVQAGLAPAQAVVALQQQAAQRQLNFFSYLLKHKLFPAAPLTQLAAQEFGLQFVDLENYDLCAVTISKFPLDLLKQHSILPLQQTEHYFEISLADPSQVQCLEEIKFAAGLPVQWVLAQQEQIQKHLLNLTSQLQPELMQEKKAANKIKEIKEDKDAPLIRYVQELLLLALNKKASDLHFEIYEQDYRLRLRIDGVLYTMATPPSQLANRIAARLKIMASLDVAEKRLPQDGRFRITLQEKQIDFRVSTCPTLFGEKIVLRLLDAQHAHFALDKLGLTKQQQQVLLQVLQQPQGMLLVTGPTGSGKTATLYTALKLLNKTELNISTVEDPVEIHLPGINQVPIHPKIGLDFATILRAFLRQDPDIIMVGEIRDLDTAEIALQAAQTGHLVLTTMHTNSAVESVNRLINLGVKVIDVASSINLIIAQRLVRRLCSGCRVQQNIAAELLLAAGFKEYEVTHLMIYEANKDGCELCTAGYQGRVGIYEFLVMTDELRALIVGGSSSLELAVLAKQQGMQDLQAAGLYLVKQGITSWSELRRVLV